MKGLFAFVIKLKYEKEYKYDILVIERKKMATIYYVNRNR